MTGPSRYTPNPQRRAQLEAAIDAGLNAAAQVVQNDVRLRFRARKHGYTTGAFAHPGRGVSATITRGAPFTRGGQRVVLIGTNSKSPDGFPYPLAWEFGHFNIFTRKQERVETFRPALFENVERVRAAFARAMARAMGGESVDIRVDPLGPASA